MPMANSETCGFYSYFKLGYRESFVGEEEQ